MSQSKPSPMTREAAARMASAVARQHGGQIPAKSVASRADAAVQRAAAKQGKATRR